MQRPCTYRKYTMVEKMNLINATYSDFSLGDLFARLKHDKIIFISDSKFREIAIALGETVKRKRKYNVIKKVGRKATQPNELLHADKTGVSCFHNLYLPQYFCKSSFEVSLL